jgi:hypothetical protein
MSELIIAHARANIRWQLLATASALAICGTICIGIPAYAEDADHPTVWIELGGQLEKIQTGENAFTPPFLEIQPRPAFETVPSAVTQRPPRYAFGGEAKAILTPEGSDWSFLAAIRVGRTNGTKEQHQQSTVVRPSGVNFIGQPLTVQLTAFGHTQATHTESHAIADFMAGKDVGLGILGGKGDVAFNFGVRFAQFTSRSQTTIREIPSEYEHRVPIPNPFFPNFHAYASYKHHHSYYAEEDAARSFAGIGPAISLSGSSPLIGKTDTVELAIDWGANAALLFGRQKARGDFKIAGYYMSNHYLSSSFPKSAYGTGSAAPISRRRSIIVPNVGGFAGLTFRRHDAKVSFGYRADFFFGAVDEGIATRRTSTVGFYGPFATISIGFGG